MQRCDATPTTTIILIIKAGLFRRRRSIYGFILCCIHICSGVNKAALDLVDDRRAVSEIGTTDSIYGQTVAARRSGWWAASFSRCARCVEYYYLKWCAIKSSYHELFRKKKVEVKEYTLRIGLWTWSELCFLVSWLVTTNQQRYKVQTESSVSQTRTKQQTHMSKLLGSIRLIKKS